MRTRTLIAPDSHRKFAVLRDAKSGGPWRLVIAASVAWLTACSNASAPAPTPLVTATPVSAAPTVAQAAPAAPQPAASPTMLGSAPTTMAPAAVSSPRPASPAPATTTSAPTAQRLAVGRGTSYHGLLFTVEEARSGQTIEGQEAPRGKMLVGIHLRLENPNSQEVKFLGSNTLNRRLRLQLPDGSGPTAESIKPFIGLIVPPHETLDGWLYFFLSAVPALESVSLTLGGGDEALVTIPFTGPVPPPTTRTFEYLRSTDEVRGLLWSVSGGAIQLDIPGQQAGPDHEFIVLNVRATNPSLEPVRLRGVNQRAERGTDYLRLRADNGVLLQVSAELQALPVEFAPKAQQDARYVWHLPRGSRNPSLVILSPDGSEHSVELGPLPPS